MCARELSRCCPSTSTSPGPCTPSDIILGVSNTTHQRAHVCMCARGCWGAAHERAPHPTPCTSSNVVSWVSNISHRRAQVYGCTCVYMGLSEVLPMNKHLTQPHAHIRTSFQEFRTSPTSVRRCAWGCPAIAHEQTPCPAPCAPTGTRRCCACVCKGPTGCCHSASPMRTFEHRF